MATKITDKLLQGFLKNPPEKKVYIREAQGFTVRRMPGGSVTFLHIYMNVDKKRRENILGQYPVISLTEAHQRHRDSLSALAAGTDPQTVKVASVTESEVGAEPEPEILTVKGLKELWERWSIQNHSKKWENTLRLAVNKDVLPIWGNRPISEIKRRDAVELLEKKAKTAPGQARNLHKALRGMWSYAVDRELVEFNPFSEIKPAKSIPKMRQISRERVLLDEEIKYLWTAIDQGGGSDSLKRCLKLILITGQRPGEVAGMRSQEIEYGQGKEICKTCKKCGWWTIPAERRQGNKGGLHRVYLSSMALESIGEKPENGIICPGSTKNIAITENAVAYHVRKLVPTTGKIPYYGLNRFTPHDLRRTTATGIAKLGATPAEVEMILGHSLGGVAAVYNRHQYDNIKQDWLQKWSDFVSQLVA